MKTHEVLFDTIERAVADIRAGEPVVVVDAADRQDEGDLIFAAEHATPALLAFTVRHGSGFVCVALTEQDADRLHLPPMCHVNQHPHGTAATVTVDASEGVGTGISAADRTRTVQLLADPGTRSTDLSRPGHVVPLRARAGGVLRRAGHTEAAVDLALLAGLRSAAVLCAIVSEDDPMRMAGTPELRRFADQHGLALVSIADLIAHRRRTERLITRGAAARVSLRAAVFTAVAYASCLDDREHTAFVHGDIGDGENVLVHVHPECLAGDVFGSSGCDCGNALRAAVDAVAAEGRGVVVYLRQANGASLNKVRAQTADHTVIAAQILIDLGVRSVRMASDDSALRAGLEDHGLSIVAQPRLSLSGARTAGATALRVWRAR